METKKEQIFNKMLNKTREVNRVITEDDARNWMATTDFPSPGDYNIDFGSFENAADLAWECANNRMTVAEALKAPKLGPKPKRGRKKGQIYPRRKRRVVCIMKKEEAIETLKKICEDNLNKIPSPKTLKDLHKKGELPSFNNLIEKLGPWPTWPDTLGYPFKEEQQYNLQKRGITYCMPSTIKKASDEIIPQTLITKKNNVVAQTNETTKEVNIPVVVPSREVTKDAVETVEVKIFIPKIEGVKIKGTIEFEVI